MIYLATASGPVARIAIQNGSLGQIVQPTAGNRLVPGANWAADNGCYGGKWNPTRWARWLASLPADRCLFAVVPDVVANDQATTDLWRQHAPTALSLGLPAAWVAQNCAIGADIPASASAVFLGGTTDWKLGADARAIASEAIQRGLWLHMGGVNSLRRLRYAAAIGCNSVDGTYLTYGPDQNLPRLDRFLRLTHQPSLGLAGLG